LKKQKLPVICKVSNDMVVIFFGDFLIIQKKWKKNN